MENVLQEWKIFDVHLFHLEIQDSVRYDPVKMEQKSNLEALRCVFKRLNEIDIFADLTI